MVTAAMIAMFYLGTASGVMGAVLVSTSRSRNGLGLEALEDVATGSEDLPRAA
jgi:hypothetical protein